MRATVVCGEIHGADAPIGSLENCLLPVCGARSVPRQTTGSQVASNPPIENQVLMFETV